LSWNNRVRQTHRWLSVAFTLTVIINIVAMGQNEAIRRTVAFLPLLPLAFLLFTGLYMFVLPYATRWRAAGDAPLENES
jgi:hypothetical protein